MAPALLMAFGDLPLFITGLLMTAGPKWLGRAGGGRHLGLAGVLSLAGRRAYENQPPASLEALTQRFQRLEARQSPDGREQWLNWVLRQRSDGALIGYVQATVQADGRALVAYELASRHWGQGLGSEAVQAMLDALSRHGQVRQALAVFKRANHRSRALLQRLGFADAAAADPACPTLEPDEGLMSRRLPG